ncbi:thiamine/molybdopterin biosynthesis protein MoeB [Pontibacillus halophilus JSM 076056 = DSM 19796]|uniref:Thiamine/molybdopterin biosynthesis protein MoeB n=1 Tax=Pontibacillus halophilus JSM 076056 = DSM 19796 TaxID=1385510 RepID=A0A0A5GK93_9BACI|nr:thiazole biosynthesis adenylyltransferase ThiF [Pontibacillus halophilus]KGX92419.1 thiamine/molybdopterin biosynthesis protein MoeB [Pontibacillus halophilus JSM 076056 = DSM 19796]
MKERYSRQQLFEPIGKVGQEQLGASHVVIIGAGALGASQAEMLVRAGIGRVTILDRDYVERSNLQRQQLYTEADAEERLPKAVAAERRLRQVNPDVDVNGYVMDVGVEELERFVPEADVVLDATDNFDTRFLINDMAQKHEVPWIYGGCVGSYGLSYTIIPGESPCLRCLLDSVPIGGATCDTVGVIAPAVVTVASYQVTETMKLLVSDHASLRKKLVVFDLWKNHHSEISVENVKKEACPSCGEHATYPSLSYEQQTKVAVLCGRDSVQIRPQVEGSRDLDELSARLARTDGGRVEINPFLLSYTQGEHRFVFFKDGRVLIHGTKDIAEAKTLYHQLLG